MNQPYDRLNARINELENAIRKHRDYRGDDRCWMDDEELYKILPEGYTPPEREVAVELSMCEKFINCRRNPKTVYISPQREIERLQDELIKLTNEEPKMKLQLKIISLEKKIDHLESMCLKKDNTIRTIECYVEDLEQLLKDEAIQHPEDAEGECNSSKAIDPRDRQIQQLKTMNRLTGESLLRSQGELHELAERFKAMSASIGAEYDKRLAELAHENDRLTQENAKLKISEEQATKRIADLENYYHHAVEENRKLRLSLDTARSKQAETRDNLSSDLARAHKTLDAYRTELFTLNAASDNLNQIIKEKDLKLAETGETLDHTRAELSELKEAVNFLFQCQVDKLGEAYSQLAYLSGNPLAHLNTPGCGEPIDYALMHWMLSVLPLGCVLEVPERSCRVYGSNTSSKLSITHESFRGICDHYELKFSPSTGLEWTTANSMASLPICPKS